MSKSLLRKSVKALLGGAILTAGLGLSASQANADIIVDLKFDNGTSATTVPAGYTGTINASLYVTVTGTNQLADELLNQVYLRIGSAQANGGAITGKIQSATLLPVWYSLFDPPIMNGQGKDWSPIGTGAQDGFGDWGTNTSSEAGTYQIVPRYNSATVKGADINVGNGQAVIDGDINGDTVRGDYGVRWKVADVVIQVNGTTTTGGTTTLNPECKTFSPSHAVVYYDGNLAASVTGPVKKSVPATITVGGAVVKTFAKIDDQGTPTVPDLTATGTQDAYKPVKVAVANAVSGTAKIVKPDAMSAGAPILVMMWLTDTIAGDGETVASLVDSMKNAASAPYTVLGPGNTEYEKWKFLGFDALLSFAGNQYPAGSTFNFHWDLGAVNANTGIRVTALGMVPEPASLGLLALGGLAMLRRRRD